MSPETKHLSLMRFVARILDVAKGYSKSDLVAFRSVASREYPSIVPLIEEYIQLVERAETDVELPRPYPKSVGRSRQPRVGEMHLFDLLRDKRLFSSNSDLAEFARRILPKLKNYRFDKMGRGDIAARIIEYLESKDRLTREKLEESMRQAIAGPASKKVDKKSFFSKWEAIIKGIQL